MKPHQKAFRIKKRKTHEKGVAQVFLPRAVPASLKALQQLCSVRWHITLQHVHGMKLTQEADHFLLGRGVVSKASSARIPDLLDRAFPIHKPDQEIGGRRETLKSAGSVVLENVPELPAIGVTMDFYMAAEPGA
jgi:hypothetical protein